MRSLCKLRHYTKFLHVMPDLIRHPDISGFRVALRLPGMTNCKRRGFKKTLKRQWQSRILSYKPYKKLSLIIFLVLALLISFSFIGNRNPKPPKIFKSPNQSPYLYETSNQSFSAKIGNKSSAFPFVSFSSPNGTNVTFSMVGSESTPNQVNNSVIYPNVFPDTDLSYTTLPNGLKEEIILSKPVTKAEYLFTLNTTAHPRPITTEFYSPFFFDDNNNYQFHLEKPFAIDAKGNRTDDISLSLRQLKEDKNAYQLRLSVPGKWLNDKNRIYPITIDPTIVHDTTAEFAAGVFNRVKDTGSGSVPSLVSYYQELPTDSNTLALYHFNNGVCANDSSGNTMTLTATGGMTCSTGGLFDYKASGFATTPVSYSHLTLMDKALTSGTIEAWINPANLSAVQTIFYADSTSDSFLTIGTSGQVSFNLSGAGTLTTPNGLVAIGVWTHIAATWTTSGRIIYVNGIEASRDIIAGTHTSQDYTTYIGIGAGGNTLPFSSSIDDLRISSVNRTPEEIKLSALRRPSSVFTSSVLDFGVKIASWNPLSWYEWGVSTGDGETPKDTTSLVAQWNFNSTSGTAATNDAGAGTCGGTASNCDFTLNNFASTGSQDSADLSGWTANNKRWGTGALMLKTIDSVDYLSMADPAGNVLDPNSSDMTIETWINTTDISNDLLANNNTNGTACTSNGYYLGIDVNGFPIFYLDTNGVTAGCDAQINSSTKKINDGLWHHVAVTITRGTAARLYVDGVLTGSDTTVTSYSSITVTGAVRCGFISGIDAILDSTRFYSRTLTPAEIVSNYQAGNIEFQTRVGATTTPDDGTWEAWKPVTSETVIDNLDNPLDYATPSASLYSLALISTSSATLPLVEGTHSLKIQTGQANSVVNTAALWHFDEASGSGAYIKDSSGNGNHGTPTGTTPTKGFTGLGRSFNGTSDYIAVGALTGGTAVKSVDFWVYPTLTTTYFIDFDGGTHVVYVNAGTVAAANFTAPTIYVNGVVSSALVVNKWQHVAVTTGTSFNANNTNIGKYGANYFAGKLDEMRISNLTFSAEEVAETYRGGRDYYINKTISSTDLSGKSSIPFYVAADRPGTYLHATFGESLFANYQPDASTIGFWRLEEPAGAGAYLKDSSGNSRHGTPTATTFVEGKIGKARNIASADDISLGSQSMFDSATDLTIDAWIRPNTQTAATQYRAIGEELVIAVGQYGGQAAFRMGNGAAWTVTDTTGGNIPINQWSHLAWIKSGTSYYIYINGVLTKSGTGAPATLGTTANVNYISTSNGTAEPWAGVIDEMRVSNVARTATEIRQAYEMGQRTHPITIDFAANLSASGAGNIATGGTITTANQYVIHTFNSSGTFTPSTSMNVEALVIAGGGAGGGSMGGGGGAGGLLYDAAHAVTAQAYTVTIGPGGVGTTSTGPSGTNSSFSSMTATGGGGGGVWNSGAGVAGGSGGGGAPFSAAGGAGTGGQGSTGGAGHASAIYTAGGGGGAGVVGEAGQNTKPGVGGNGLSYSISGSAAYYAGGGGGGGYNATCNGQTAQGGLGGGGTGTCNNAQSGTAGTANTGGGGGGGEYTGSGGNGGSGIVILRYPLTTELISSSSDLSFTIDATTFGFANKGSNLFPGDKVIIKENYDGTEYIAQGTVNTIDTSSGDVTVTAWDTGSTFPSIGFSTSASVFKWQREYWNIDGEVLDTSLDTITNLTLRLSDGNEGRNIWLDDLRSSSGYLTTSTGSTIASSIGSRYLQYRAIFSSFDEAVSATLSGVTVDYVPNVVPNIPTLDFPADTAISQPLSPVFKTTATDTDSDYLRYKIEICTNVAMTVGCVTPIDQTSSQTGWSGQDTESGTAYLSGSQATFTVQTPLSANTTYYWRSYAIDPNGANSFGSTQATPFSFTTNAPPNTPSLDLPTDTATNQTVYPLLKTTTTDTNSDNIKYKIEICTNGAMSLGCQTYDQTISQTGWSGQNAESGTTYTSGTQGIFTVQTALSGGTTYYWRSYAIDPGGSNLFGSTQGTPYSFTTSTAPTAPTTPFADGQTNPIGLTNLTPVFSAIHHDPSGDAAVKYQIQVNTNSSFTDVIMWDSSETSMTSTADNIRSPNITYAGNAIPLDGAGTVYYWRIRFTDVNGVIGAWSATQSFTMNAKPAIPSLDLPTDTATNVSITPILKTTTTDVESNYVRYKIIICTDLNMTINCQTYDQTASQTGWSGQDTETSTAYLSGTQGVFTVQTALAPNTTYFWKSSAIDPGGSITFGSTQTTPFSFTTLSPPPTASACTVTKNPTNTEIIVNWTDNATSEDGYQIWKVTDGGLPALIPPDLAANIITYTDSTVTSGHSYGYLVRSFKLDGANTVYSNFCTTATSNLSTGSFGFEGLKLGGLKLN